MVGPCRKALIEGSVNFNVLESYCVPPALCLSSCTLPLLLGYQQSTSRIDKNDLLYRHCSCRNKPRRTQGDGIGVFDGSVTTAGSICIARAATHHWNYHFEIIISSQSVMEQIDMTIDATKTSPIPELVDMRQVHQHGISFPMNGDIARLRHNRN